jgi:hypothetical protein
VHWLKNTQQEEERKLNPSALAEKYTTRRGEEIKS